MHGEVRGNPYQQTAGGKRASALSLKLKNWLARLPAYPRKSGKLLESYRRPQSAEIVYSFVNIPGK